MHALQPRLLKVLDVVARAGSMRKAAARLNVSPLDLGLAFGFRRDPNIREIVSIETRSGLVVAPSHPLASRSVVKLADCVGYPLILPGAGTVFRSVLDEAFAKTSLNVDPVIEATNFEMMKRFVILDRGVAFLNRINVDFELRRGELIFIPVRESHLLSEKLTLFQRERGALSTVASQFAESMRKAFEEMGPKQM